MRSAEGKFRQIYPASQYPRDLRPNQDTSTPSVDNNEIFQK